MERSAALPVPSLFRPVRVFFSCAIPHFLVGIIGIYTVGYSASIHKRRPVLDNIKILRQLFGLFFFLDNIEVAADCRKRCSQVVRDVCDSVFQFCVALCISN